MNKIKVAFISMPFGFLWQPNAGTSLLQSYLSQKDIYSKTFYLNIDFAKLVGLNSYNAIEKDFDYYFVTARKALRPDFDDIGWFNESNKFSYDKKTFLYRVREFYEKFVDGVAENPVWNNFDVFGLTCNNRQIPAVFTMARLLKERFPNKIVVLGGIGLVERLSDEIINRLPYIDAVFTGRADNTFPLIIEKYQQSNDWIKSCEELDDGVVFKRNNETIICPNKIKINHNDIPLPNFDDFKKRESELEAIGMSIADNVYYPLEFSQGCWWGDKNACTFCADPYIFPNAIPKTYSNALLYLNQAKTKYPDQKKWLFADPLIPRGYIQNVFKQLKNQNIDIKYFCEMKPWLTPKEWKILSESGMDSVQIGIESLSPDNLKLVKKGHTVYHAISALNFAKLHKIHTAWNLLYMIPHETIASYDEQCKILPNLFHFQSPTTMTSISITPNSHYWENKEKYGLTKLIPFFYNKYVYPENFDYKDKVWDYSYDTHPSFSKAANKLFKVLYEWIACNRGLIHQDYRKLIFTNDGIMDGRSGSEREIKLSDEERSILLYCSFAKSLTKIKNFFKRDDIALILYKLVELKLMYQEGSMYVSYVEVTNQYNDDWDGLSDNVKEEPPLIQLTIKEAVKC